MRASLRARYYERYTPLNIKITTCPPKTLNPKAYPLISRTRYPANPIHPDTNSPPVWLQPSKPHPVDNYTHILLLPSRPCQQALIIPDISACVGFYIDQALYVRITTSKPGLDGFESLASVRLFVGCGGFRGGIYRGYRVLCR